MSNKSTLYKTLKPSLFLVVIFISNLMFAQGKRYYYLVTFKDKTNSKYSVQKPQEFLSKRSIERRKKLGIKTDETDFPVNEKYVKQLVSKGYRVHYTTRWLNGAIVSSEKEELDKLKGIANVIGVQALGGYTKSKTVKPTEEGADTRIEVTNSYDIDHTVYGSAYKQAQMLNVDKLHEQGYRGAGIWVAVLDAGFRNANRLSVFDSLFGTSHYLGSYDIADEDNWVFSEDNHGTQVLSCMAAQQTELMTGTAPEASYYLFRTENASVELPLEEAFWLIAVERADSMGIDIINSSLGYTRFDNSEYGHDISEVNGYYSIATRAANFAWGKGMIIVNSAGNEGDGSWQYIGCPADAIGTIAVAAVTESRNRAYFSSYGKSGMARQKPDLAAMGEDATVCHPAGYISKANGTSFASPILCGAIVSLMSSAKDVNPVVLRHILYESASQFENKDFSLGYGIPDMEQCYTLTHPEKLGSQYIYNWPGDSVVALNFKPRTLNPDAINWDIKYYDTEDNLIMITNFSRNGGRAYSTELSPDFYYGSTYVVKFEKNGEVIYTKTFSIAEEIGSVKEGEYHEYYDGDGEGKEVVPDLVAPDISPTREKK